MATFQKEGAMGRKFDFFFKKNGSITFHFGGGVDQHLQKIMRMKAYSCLISN